VNRTLSKVEPASVGVDIGASAVRAAEVALDRGGRRLRRYAQVGLPPGAVVDGEVVNARAVAEALKRLWAEGGFSTKKVVIGVAGHRVFVRQADVPALDEEDLRSALRFDAQELIPVPMDSASFDFQVLERAEGEDDQGRKTTRILLVAAHKDLLRSHLDALKMAGLEARAIDATALALLRVVPVSTARASDPQGPGLPPLTAAPGGDARVEAVVSIGAEMTTVAVRQNGVPRFIRSLAVGGSKLTKGIAGALHVDPAVAERLKRDSEPGRLVQAAKVVSAELRDLAEEVRATIDFFVVQAEGMPVERLLITGGASQAAGLVEALSGDTSVVIERVDPFSGLLVEDLGLDQAGMARARANAAVAVGLALWPVSKPEARLSILPEEIAEARRSRRLMAVGAMAVAGVAGALVVATAAGALAGHQARDAEHSAERQQAILQSRVSALEARTKVHAEVMSRESALSSALRGEIDWVSVLNHLSAVTPSGLSVQSFSGTSSPSVGSTGGGTSSAGTVTLQVQGIGGLPAAAAWLDYLGRDPQVAGTTVSSVSVTNNGGQVAFSSNTNLTTQAESAQGKGQSR
jgi:type IV pilus assembly protein PilM